MVSHFHTALNVRALRRRRERRTLAPTVYMLLDALAYAFAPWTAALTGDAAYEMMVLGWLAALFLVHYLVTFWLNRKPHCSPLKKELIKRPTVVPVTIHSLLTTVAAAVMISPPMVPSVDAQPWDVQLWRRGVLPFSTAYWIFDIYNYCLPKRDMLIAVHHLIIMFCNYPVGDNAGLAAAAAQLPACNFVMMSTNGYVLELTTFLLYIRWCPCHAARVDQLTAPSARPDQPHHRLQPAPVAPGLRKRRSLGDGSRRWMAARPGSSRLC